jgi:hypothetical protein
MTHRVVLLAVLLAGCAGCDKLVGLSGSTTPLATVRFQVTGETPSPAPARLRVALVWGAEWLPEPFCILPAESPRAATVIAAGCRDSFGFAPLRVAANAATAIGTAASFDLYDLPAADDMVGDVTARIAYGSLVAYDDRDGDGTLGLARPAGAGGGMMPSEMGPTPALDTPDVIYGASFVTMTEPDRRIAYREGGFNAAAAFYPRNGCPPPPPAFSVLGAGGFSAEKAVAALSMGMLPPQDPASCTEAGLDQTTVDVPLRPLDSVRQLKCQPTGGTTGQTRYREPREPWDLASVTWACAGLPDLGRLPGVDGGAPATSTMQQLVIAGPPTADCKGLLHYTLRGCRNDPMCAMPEWDLTATPPAWWPCPRSP